MGFFDTLNSKYILLFLLIVILLIIILKYLYSILNQSSINLNNFMKIYTSAPTLNSINLNMEEPLRNFYIKTAYNCCCTGKFKNGYVDLGALEICLSQGVRCLDFQIYSIEDKPVVAASSVNCFNNKETYNSIPVENVLNTIKQLAFSSSICSNSKDPLILHFRIMNNNANMYNNFAEIINNSNLPRLPNKYSNEYTTADSNDNKVKNLGAEKIKEFKEKVIFIIHGADTFYRSTQLDEFINMASGQAFMHLINYSEIKNNHNQEITTFNKNNMSIVIPDKQTNYDNPNFNLSRKLGCQFIAMSFHNNDENLKQYNQYFNDSKSAFVLKPNLLRSPRTVI